MLTESGLALPLEEVKFKTHVPAAATAAVVTIAAVTLTRHVLMKVYWSYSAAPTGGKLTITGDDEAFEVDIIAGGPGAMSLPYVANRSTALVITLASGAGAVQGKLNVSYYSKRFE